MGFTITPRRSTRTPPKTITDLDFADDICLLSNEIQQAQELLTRVETACKKVGLEQSARKTEVMTYNIQERNPIKTTTGTELKKVGDFKYLGSLAESTEANLKIRKALV